MSDSQSAFREAKAELSFLRWIFGWHPVVGWAMVVLLLGGIGYYFGAAYLFALVGLVAGGPIWYQGMRYINRNWESLRTAYIADVEEYGPVVLEAAGMDEGTEVTLLTKASEETQPFVEAPSQIDATLVGVDDAGVWIHGHTSLDLTFQKASFGTDPDGIVHFPYSNLAAAVFEDGDLVVRPIRETDDLKTFRTPLTEEPVELLATIREEMEVHPNAGADGVATDSGEPGTNH
ncbi:MAG: hypothetical protein U5K70_02525 [Halodesulfurarchaeum sp.]|nr:hypothetical protein [Halodesulfurarchaeum sp.]